MEFQAALGILVVIGFGYFIYKKVTAKKSGGTGGGNIRDPEQDHDKIEP